MESFMAYLPLVKCCSSSQTLSWSPKAVQILIKMKKGRFKSAKKLVVAVSDLRNAIPSSSPSSSKYYFRRFLDLLKKIMSREESRKWFNEVVPALAKLLLKLPYLLEAHYQNASMDIRGDGTMLTTALRILESQQPGVVCLSQELIAALLSCSFFCLFPDNNRTAKHLPLINFDQLFKYPIRFNHKPWRNKIWCILHYFERIVYDMPKGIVSFERRLVSNDANFWSESAIPLCKFEIHTSEDVGDLSSEAVEVYFTDQNLGSEALSNGTTEVELRFMFSPELIVGMLFLPAMADNEAIEIVGVERFTTARGFQSSFRHSNVYVDKTAVDTLGRRKTRIVAVDFLHIPKRSEYTADMFLRVINKAFCGFMYHGTDQAGNNIGVATESDKDMALYDIDLEYNHEIRAIIKWLAASQAKRPFIAYCKSNYFDIPDIGEVVGWILSQRWTVGEVWKMLMKYSTNINTTSSSKFFFQWIQLSYGHTHDTCPAAVCDVCERQRVSSRMNNFISKYLPFELKRVVVERHLFPSSLSWSPKALQILNKLKQGLCQTWKELEEVIRVLGGVCAKLDGFALFFHAVMSEEESRKWCNEVFPALAKLLLNLPNLLLAHYQNANMDIRGDGTMLTTTLRILDSHQPGIVCLSQELIASLLACSLFSLFPDDHRPAKHLPIINFNQLFETLAKKFHDQKNLNKIWCIVHYFERITSDMPKGIVSFERKALTFQNDSISISCPDATFWNNSAIPLCKFKVHSSGLIEDQSSEAVEVYFASKNLGGNALGMGTSQEEIRFMLNPELIAGMLFLPTMTNNEAIEIVGAENFSTYTGFASSFRFSDAYVNQRDVDNLGRRKTRIVAVNELCTPEIREYTIDIFLREINKAFCGFLYHGMEQGNNIGVATGDMVFTKDPEIKAIILWLAASQAQRPFIAYRIFGLKAFQNLDKVALWILSQSWTVGFLWNVLINYSTTTRSKGHSFLQWFQRSYAHGCDTMDLTNQRVLGRGITNKRKRVSARIIKNNKRISKRKR